MAAAFPSLATTQERKHLLSSSARKSQCPSRFHNANYANTTQAKWQAFPSQMDIFGKLYLKIPNETSFFLAQEKKKRASNWE